MRKLLHANVSCLRYDRAFWLLAALMAALGASMAVVNAVHARQADIQEDQIPFLPGEHTQGRFRIAGHGSLDTAQLQALCQRFGKGLFVVDDEYTHDVFPPCDNAST